MNLSATERVCGGGRVIGVRAMVCTLSSRSSLSRSCFRVSCCRTIGVSGDSGIPPSSLEEMTEDSIPACPKIRLSLSKLRSGAGVVEAARRLPLPPRGFRRAGARPPCAITQSAIFTQIEQIELTAYVAECVLFTNGRKGVRLENAVQCIADFLSLFGDFQ